MKPIRKLALLWVVLLCGSGMRAQEQISVPLTSQGKSFSLNVGLLKGSIKVTTHQGSEIIIEATGISDSEDEGPAEKEGLRRISNPRGYELNVTENNNEVNVGNNNFNSAVNLSIKIPQQEARLKLNSVENGDIEVSNVKGELEISNVDGSIKIDQISGSVVANTISGDVTVSFLGVNSEAAMAFTTLSGDINLTLPAGTNANLKLKSDMGEMYSDFDLVIDPASTKPVVSEENGIRKLEKASWVQARINKGGPEYMMKSMSGNIYIKKAK